MNLLLRVNLALVVVFALGASITGLSCRTLLLIAHRARAVHHELRVRADLVLGLEPHYQRLCAYLQSYLAGELRGVVSAAGPTAAAPAHAAILPPSAAVLQQLESELARYIGPVARHLVNRAAARGAGPETLICELSAEIESEADRRAFVNASRQALRGRL
jgi:hypothetical protein